MMNLQAKCGRYMDRSLAAPGSQLRHQNQCSGLHHESAHTVRRKITVHARVKAAAVESPATIDSKPKTKTSAKGSPEITPEEAADLYRDMKLGRDFEEM